MKADLLIHPAAQIFTLTGSPQRGPDLGKLELIEYSAVAITGEDILPIGTRAETTTPTTDQQNSAR